MAASPQAVTGAAPTRVVAERIRELRGRRGWSAEVLARRVETTGLKMDRSVVANIELGRRERLSIEELFAFAYALDVSPLHLLLPEDPAEGVLVTPQLWTDAGALSVWLGGEAPLSGQSLVEFTRALVGVTHLQQHVEAPRIVETPPALPPAAGTPIPTGGVSTVVGADTGKVDADDPILRTLMLPGGCHDVCCDSCLGEAHADLGGDLLAVVACTDPDAQCMWCGAGGTS